MCFVLYIRNFHSVLYFVYIISPLDRNFVLAKICVFVKVYVFYMDTYAKFIIQYNVSFHVHPIMHIPSSHCAHFIRSHRFFPRDEDERRHWCWLVSASCLIFTDVSAFKFRSGWPWIFLERGHDAEYYSLAWLANCKRQEESYSREFRSLINLYSIHRSLSLYSS